MLINEPLSSIRMHVDRDRSSVDLQRVATGVFQVRLGLSGIVHIMFTAVSKKRYEQGNCKQRRTCQPLPALCRKGRRIDSFSYTEKHFRCYVRRILRSKRVLPSKVKLLYCAVSG